MGRKKHKEEKMRKSSKLSANDKIRLTKEIFVAKKKNYSHYSFTNLTIKDCKYMVDYDNYKDYTKKATNECISQIVDEVTTKIEKRAILQKEVKKENRRTIFNDLHKNVEAYRIYKYGNNIKDNSIKDVILNNIELLIDMDWERKRKQTGCVLTDNLKSVGLFTETNGRGGWDKVSWHYNNIYFTQTGNKILLVSNTCTEVYKYKISKLNNRIYLTNGNSDYRFDLKRRENIDLIKVRRNIMKHYNKILDSGKLIVDSKKLCYVEHNEMYHFADNDLTSKTFSKKIEYAHSQIERRRNEKYVAHLLNNLQSLNLSSIFVERQDSLNAGNCVTMTDSFIKEIKEKFNLDSDQFALRADLLLKYRNDNFTKRAVIQSYKNHYAC